MRRIAFFGGGGLAKEIADVVSSNNCILVGYFAPEVGALKANYLGVENEYDSSDDIDRYFPAIGSVSKESHLSREKILNNLEKLNVSFCNVISQKANISIHTEISLGIYVAPNVNIAPDVTIANYAIIGANSVISHDVIIGRNVHIAPSSTINGGVVIGSNVLIGSGAIILQGVKIGDNSIIGAGAIVFFDVKANSTILPPFSR
jgi:sugar O-acyltransferase (sialic acid O-acetyltransferase NeuD family)